MVGYSLCEITGNPCIETKSFVYTSFGICSHSYSMTTCNCCTVFDFSAIIRHLLSINFLLDLNLGFVQASPWLIWPRPWTFAVKITTYDLACCLAGKLPYNKLTTGSFPGMGDSALTANSGRLNRHVFSQVLIFHIIRLCSFIELYFRPILILFYDTSFKIMFF